MTRVFCCCGVDMEFVWPRGQDAVRCFGCGRRFARPDHFAVRAPLTWVRPTPPGRWAWFRAHRGVLLLFLGMLLGALIAAAALT
jgi:hypothetical protein